MKSKSIFSTAGSILLSLIVLVAFTLLSDVLWAQALGSRVKIVIDASQQESLPQIYRPGLSVEGRGSPHHVYSAGNPVLKKFEREVGFDGTFRFYIWLQRTGLGPGNEVQLSEYLPWLKRIQKGGGRILLTLMGVPRWLSSCRLQCDDWNMEHKWAMSPPKDYKKYAGLIYEIIKFYSVDSGLTSIFYEIWAEPDHPGYWRGSDAQYLEVYKAASKAVLTIRKRYGVDIKVGGPGPQSWNSYRDRDNSIEADEEILHKTIIYKLIAHCYKDKLPLDFISFHRYDNDSKYHSIRRTGQFIQKWLKDFSFDPTLPLIVTEWNFWLDNLERNNEKGASFIPAAIYDMDKAGLSYHTFFSLQDFGNMDPSPGGLGLFTVYGVAKPSYNFYIMLSKLGPHKLNTTISDDHNIGAVATLRPDGKIAILLWNYAQLDPPKVFERAILHQKALETYFRSLSAKKRTALLDHLKAIAKEEQYQNQVNRLSVENTIKKDIISAIKNYQSALTAQHQPIKVSINLKNITQTAQLNYSRWLIDANHSNGFRDNLEFLLAIKLKVLRKTVKTFQNEGFSQKDLETIASLIGEYLSGLHRMQPEKTAAAKRNIASLPKQLNAKFKKVTERFNANIQQIQGQLIGTLHKQAMSINQRPSAQLQRVEKKMMPARNSLEWQLVLEPYSVTLMLLE